MTLFGATTTRWLYSLTLSSIILVFLCRNDQVIKLVGAFKLTNVQDCYFLCHNNQIAEFIKVYQNISRLSILVDKHPKALKYQLALDADERSRWGSEVLDGS